MKLGLLVVGASVGVACAAGPPRAADAPRTPRDAPGSERALPIPADLAPHIQESIELGRILYFLDKASAIGTDVLAEKVPDFGSRGLAGWITVQNADEAGKPAAAFGVLFISNEEPPRVLFRVDVPLQGKPTFKEVSPPTVLDDIGIRLFRARQTAIQAIEPGRRPFNPVILPGSAVGRPGTILVYLLAAEQRAGEMVFGIHYRVLVSDDGNVVKQALPLSRSALVIPPASEIIPKGATPTAAYVSQIVTDWPLETHVFVSMLHGRTPIYVGTKRGTWLVIGDKITFVDDKPPSDARP